MTDRYYAQCTEIDPLFTSNQENGWQIFDRQFIGSQGQTRPIVFCINRSRAFEIRDLLNKKEGK